MTLAEDPTVLPWRLTCLGYPTFSSPGGEQIRLRTRKHLAVLIYLAIESTGYHRRDKLAAMLWPRAGTDESRHSLATALSVLRGRLGADAFDARRDAVRLVSGRVMTDVALLLSGRAAPGDVTPSPFLAEFEIADAPDFSAWVDIERSHLLPPLHAHVADQIAHARRNGNTRDMESLADLLTHIDPLSEHAAHAMMEVRALAGNRIGAIRGYDQWRKRLAEEFGTRPSENVDRIADRLRRRGLDCSSTRPPSSAATVQSQKSVFVGRDEEFRICYDIWQNVLQGRAQHITILGDDGVGKTTLVDRVATTIALTGAGVVRLQCYELEQELPYGLVGGLVAQLLDLPGAAGTAPHHLAELSRLVSRVRERWPALPSPSPTSGEETRLQFTEALWALMESVVDEAPLIIAIDDIQWADATSLSVLHLLLRRVHALSLMCIFSSCDQDIASVHFPIHSRQAADAGLHTTVTLQPLGATAARELLDTLLPPGVDPGPSVRRAILRGARGMPMTMELLVDDWHVRGASSLALTLTPPVRDIPSGRSETFSILVAKTLSRLDEETRSVAALAAVLGQRLNDLAFYSLLDLSVAKTMRALSVLTQARILRDAGDHLTFTNDIVRAHCYAAMPQPVLCQLHADVTARLVDNEERADPIGGLEIAWHLVRADRLHDAVPYLLTGAYEAIHHGGPHEADLALSASLPVLRGQERNAAICLLAEALHELSRWRDALTLLETEGTEWSGDDACHREVLQIVSHRFLGTLSTSSLPATVDRLCCIAAMPIAHEIRVTALSAIPYLQSQSRDASGLSRLTRAISSLDGVPLAPYQTLQMQLVRAWLRLESAQANEATAELSTGMQIARQHGFRSSVAIRVRIGMASTLSANGDYGQAQAHLLEALTMAEEIDNMTQVAVCRAGLAIAAGRLGQHRDQVDWALQAIAILPPDDWSMISLSALNELASGLLTEGRSQEALDRCADISRRCRRTCPPWAEQTGLLMQADLFWLAAKHQQALRCAKRALLMSHSEPLVPDLCGAYARWIALLGNGATTATSALATLLEGPLATKPLHRKDRAEWLAAVVYLKRGMGTVNAADTAALRDALRAMGAPLTDRLIHLGLVPEMGTRRTLLGG